MRRLLAKRPLLSALAVIGIIAIAGLCIRKYISPPIGVTGTVKANTVLLRESLARIRSASFQHPTQGNDLAHAEVDGILQVARELEAQRKPDWKRIFEEYKKAYELGSPYAALRIGNLIEKGYLSQFEKGEAIQYYEEALKRGCVEANGALSRVYMEGRLTGVDIVRAMAYAEAGIKAGDPQALFLKGSMLVDGASGDEGLNLLISAAEKGNSSAQLAISRLYRDGKLFDKDLNQSMEWLTLSAKGGDISAQTDLALILATKLRANPESLTPQERILLKESLDGAASHGSAAALTQLVVMTLASRHLTADQAVLARNLAETAFDQGKSDAAFVLAASYSGGENTRDYAQHWLDLGAADNDWRSRYALQLERSGIPIRDAISTAANAQYSEFANFFSGKGNIPDASMTPPVSISMPAPVFPTGLAGMNVKGAVTMEFMVGTDGKTYSIQPLNPTHPQLADAAVKAVEGWTFAPAKKNGQPIAVKIKVPIRFTGNGL